MKVLVIGGSKNIGYFAAQRLLASGATVTFLLRNAAAFEADKTMIPYVASGKARIVSGDALKEADVRRAWLAAEGNDGPVDALIFTVGGYPKFSLSNGFVLDPPDLCTRSMSNVLATMPRIEPTPKIILLSSAGLTKSSHAAVPFLFKPLYGSLLDSPHADKLGMERVVAHAAGWDWTEKEPANTVLPPGWQSRLPEAGFLKHALVVRPAILVDGACKAEDVGRKGKGYRVSDTVLKSCYTVSRRDVAHFIVEEALANWDSWEGKCAQIGY